MRDPLEALHTSGSQPQAGKPSHPAASDSGGLASLTIQELAARVGVTEAALYRHVRSKDEVLLLLVDEIRMSLFQAISEAIRKDQTALEKLEHMLQFHLSYLEERRGVSFVIISEALRFGEPLVKSAARRLVDDYVDLVDSIVSEGRSTGDIADNVDPEGAAVMFSGWLRPVLLAGCSASRCTRFRRRDQCSGACSSPQSGLGYRPMPRLHPDGR